MALTPTLICNINEADTNLSTSTSELKVRVDIDVGVLLNVNPPNIAFHSLNNMPEKEEEKGVSGRKEGRKEAS